MQHLKPQHLMLPGPTPLPPAVHQALSGPMLNHRAELWQDLFREVRDHIQWLLQTQRDILFLAGSGTTGMEASLTNLFSPGDRVLALTQGSFSERFAQMAECFGLEVESLSLEWGEAFQAETVEARLQQSAGFKAVLLVHNETSTGVLNPLKDLAEVIHRYGAMVIVDAISSLSTTELLTDNWDLDVVITASQKGYQVPAGLSMVTLNDRAWEACEQASLPRFTYDFKLTREYAHKALTPWTPPVPLFHALATSLPLLKAQGLLNLHARHYQLMRAARAGLKALGCRLLVADEHIASRAVTPAYPPEGLRADDILMLMHNNFHIAMGAGQRKMSGQLIRLGHLGYQDLPALYGVLSALEYSFKELGHQVPHSAAEAALEAVKLV